MSQIIEKNTGFGENLFSLNTHWAYAEAELPEANNT